MITCAEAVRQLWDYLDGAVDDSQREQVEEHLAFCRRCCGELEFAEELRAFLTSHAQDELPPDIHARLRATLDELGRR
jgi:anti-sigma factor (TIGR02949 family)